MTIAATDLGGTPLASAFVVAETHAGPGRQMLGILELIEIWPNLNQDVTGVGDVDARNGLQQVRRLFR